ncbi:N2227-like protein [Musa troglodytarum]|uniref:N2227-like protein n=1 Tax=Musa troglodytarum TaxID=320322 RepID=A0A9E7GT67_9LILI|nr:N2227-like protein [Musa troglodytarum]
MDRRQHEEEVRVDEAAATTGQRRYSKLEEALEIKSLRRIISAYLKVKRNVTNVINLFLRSLIAYFHIVPKTESIPCSLLDNEEEPVIRIYDSMV